MRPEQIKGKRDLARDHRIAVSVLRHRTASSVACFFLPLVLLIGILGLDAAIDEMRLSSDMAYGAMLFCLFGVGVLALLMRSMERAAGRLRDKDGKFVESEDEFFSNATARAEAVEQINWLVVWYAGATHLMTFFWGAGMWLLFIALPMKS